MTSSPELVFHMFLLCQVPQGGLYEGPRDLYFSYRQSNQLLRSLLPD